ncbi:hypothetical protein [Fischerella sp. JS2]|uniref:hypothetical protein n=1 Tax=Fischerella sp. JS2 TaxID=2597771 RepID=UPI0028EE1F5C|nr:hypothetical protein [Fischerella sp. JS2]
MSLNGQKILQVKLLVQHCFTFGSSHLTNFFNEFKKLHQQVDLILYVIAVIAKSTDSNVDVCQTDAGTLGAVHVILGGMGGLVVTKCLMLQYLTLTDFASLYLSKIQIRRNES